MTFAIFETGGKQHLVSTNHKIRIEKLSTSEKVTFDKVLLVADGGNVKIGNPYIEGAKIEAQVLKHGRGKKIKILKYHSKTRYRRHKGHRQEFTEVKITNI